MEERSDSIRMRPQYYPHPLLFTLLLFTLRAKRNCRVHTSNRSLDAVWRVVCVYTYVEITNPPKYNIGELSFMRLMLHWDRGERSEHRPSTA